MGIIHITIPGSISSEKISAPRGPMYEEEARAIDEWLKAENLSWNSIYEIYYLTGLRKPYLAMEHQILGSIGSVDGYQAIVITTDFSNHKKRWELETTFKNIEVEYDELEETLKVTQSRKTQKR